MYMPSKIPLKNAQILLQYHKCHTCDNLLTVFNSVAMVMTDAFWKNWIKMLVKFLNLWEYLSRWNLSKTGRSYIGPKESNLYFPCYGAVTFKFVYALTGWEGSVTDACIYEDVLLKGLHIPEVKYYLADAEFSNCEELLILYCGVQYHLVEWGRVGLRFFKLFSSILN